MQEQLIDQVIHEVMKRVGSNGAEKPSTSNGANHHARQWPILCR